MTRILRLSEKSYNALAKAADRSGISIVDRIARRLPDTVAASDCGLTVAEIASANARLESCIVDYGRALGTDNEDIDADLARAYEDIEA